MKYLENKLSGAKKFIKNNAKRIVKNPITYLFFASMPFLFYSCDKPDDIEPVPSTTKKPSNTPPDDKPSDEPEDNPEDVPEEISNRSGILLTENNLDEISYYSNGTIYLLDFSGELASLKKGNYIYSADNEIFPFGLFRKVESVSGNEIKTSEANPLDIIDNCDTSIIMPIYLLENSLFKSTPSASGLGFDYSFENKVLLDADGNSQTTLDQVVANGDFSLTPHMEFKLKIKNFDLEKFLLKISLDEYCTIALNAPSNLGNIEKEKNLYHKSYKPFTIWLPSPIGTIPLTFTPELDFYSKLSGQIPKFSSEIYQQVNISGGFSYKDGNWEDLRSYFPSFELKKINLSSDANVTFALTGDLALLLYGSAGTYGELEAYTRLEASPQNQDIYWELYGGLKFNVGAKARLFSKTLFDKSATLAQFENNFGSGKIENTSPIKDLDSIVIQPGPGEGKDAEIMHVIYSDGSESFAGKGDDQELLVSYQDAPFVERRALIKFPLEQIPSNINITSAKFSFYGQSTNNYFNVNPKIKLYKLEGSWDESTVKWNTKPASSFILEKYFSNGGGKKWHDFDITSTVKNWKNGDTNNGIEISTSNESDVWIYSSDYSVGDEHPKLVIYYEK